MTILYNTLIDVAIVAAAGLVAWGLIAYFKYSPWRLPLSMMIARPQMPPIEKELQRERVLSLCADRLDGCARRPCDGPTGDLDA